MAGILATVLHRVKPRKSDIKRVEDAAAEMVRRTDEAAAELKIDAQAMLVGSVARGTWLREEPDIDVFILFQDRLSREELEKRGLAVARSVAGSVGRERFAEHPYVTMKFRGLDIDLVPCYDVADSRKIKSAVDRTPHHQRYVTPRLGVISLLGVTFSENPESLRYCYLRKAGVLPVRCSARIRRVCAKVLRVIALPGIQHRRQLALKAREVPGMTTNESIECLLAFGAPRMPRLKAVRNPECPDHILLPRSRRRSPPFVSLSPRIQRSSCVLARGHIPGILRHRGPKSLAPKLGLE